MRGLLTKDYKIILHRKKNLFLILLIAIILSFNSDPTFILFYFPFVILNQALGTISYDELDNGMPFLFTMPITRKLYVQSKYLLLVLTTAISCVVAFGLMLILMLIQKIPITSDDILGALTIIPMFLLLMDIMLPIHFKFGIERIRTIYMLFYGAIAATAVVIGYFFDKAGIQTNSLLEKLDSLNQTALFSGLFVGLLLLTVVSYYLSTHIVRKKQL